MHFFSDPWHFIEFGVLLMASLIVAIKEYGKDIPDTITNVIPDYLKSRHLAAAPLFLVVIFGLLLFFDHLNILPLRSQAIAPPGTPMARSEPSSPAPIAKLNTRIIDPQDDRVYVSKDPKEIMDILEGKMLIEQSRIAAPYIGKWMKLTIVVDDISISEQFSAIWVDGVRMYFRFDNKWNARLEVLSKGQTIDVIGKINKIRARSIEFEECELF